MKIFSKILTWFILPLCIVGLAFLCVKSVMQPVDFQKQQTAREKVAIQRLKDIRTLQVAFKSETGHFASTIDSLIAFYNDGTIKVVMQVGSNDDSLAVANTAKLKRRRPKISAAEMLDLYNNGEALVFKIESKIPVKDTLCNRPDFVADSLKYIPYSGGQEVLLESIVKTVSGVKVPLFEASMPYKALLNGMDHQLIVNLVAEREDTDRYPGLKVGSVTSPNNNAGNWE
ncbi:MAG: hypothetical protein MJY56_05150 [Bacteroidales bacterium]|nr:hypothetical protein [Bacteroidales bacterium]